MVQSDVKFCLKHLRSNDVFDQYKVEVWGDLILFDLDMPVRSYVNGVRALILASGTKINYERPKISQKEH